jgi:AraC-like DNA-binding protein/ligand-binding sensor protein
MINSWRILPMTQAIAATGYISQIRELTIINRREIEPLLVKARRVLGFYEQSTGCTVSVQNRNGYSVLRPETGKNLCFCEFCKLRCPNSPDGWSDAECPCAAMHQEAMTESRRIGGSYIYSCEMGFIYWTSPLCTGGRYAGALLAGQVLAAGKQWAVERLYSRCGGVVPKEDIMNFLAGMPEKSHEEVKSLARILQICAGEISDGSEDSRDTVRRFSRQDSNLSIQINRIRSQISKNGRHKEQPGPVYPMDRERILLATLRRGDQEAGRKILNELLETILMTSPGNLEFIRFRAIELVVLLSRAAATPEHSEDAAVLETSNRYLRRIQDSRTVEELIENLHIIMDRMAGQIFSFQGVRHASALRKAERFIWENYTRKISLQEIASASGLSAPYFSTIFKEEMGENLSSYLNRLRVEKAAVLLSGSVLSLNEIAAACGFEDQSWFSKIFKSFTGISPGKYREQGGGMLPVKAGRSKDKKENN